LFFLTFAAKLFSQSTDLRPFVFSSAGIEFEYSTAYLSMTIGQPFYQTFQLSDFALTQGFQQPNGPKPETNVSYQIEFHECDQMYYILVDTAMICSDQPFTFLWNGNLGDSLFSTNSTSVQLQIETESGCIWQTEINVLTEEVTSVPCPLIFYSLITPNSDGDNDAWIIENIDESDFSENKVVILNRWGNEVWKAENYNNDNVVWTGISDKGQALPDGTYFYSVDTRSLSFRGYVELHR
jgi:gliding motility-associated-like protein